MKIQSINNNNVATNYYNQKNRTNPNFRARFSEKMLKEMTSSFNTDLGTHGLNMEEFAPRLYTLLERLDEIIPGAMARLENRPSNAYAQTLKNGYDVIWLGGSRLCDVPRYDKKNTAVDILEQALVCDKKSVYRNTGYLDRLYMPRSVYEAKYWENRHKTVNDIIKDFSFKE